ncbi:MAG TPA: helix-turn-helix domain-containing protein [Novosphingobium sp.]
MPVIRSYSTEEIPGALRLDAWNTFLQTAFPGIVVDGSPDIHGDSRTFALGTINVSRIRSQRATVRRWSMESAIVPNGRGKIHIQTTGLSTTTQRGQTTSLSPGDATFVLTDEPYELEISDRNEMLVIEFPVSCLAAGPIVPGFAGDRTSPIGGVLKDMAASLFRQPWTATIASDEAEALEASFSHLIPLFVAHTVCRIDRDHSDLRQRIFAFIDANISDSAMRTSRIADSLGVQTRDVQSVFAELATTPTSYIIERRLSLAAQRLGGACRQSGLSDLAYDLGFSDAAHFCRRFKSRFGVSPGVYARQQQWH